MIFILGSKGFVGTGICNFLQTKGLDFKGIDLDNYKEMMGNKCDILINVAGSSLKRLAEQSPKTDFQRNVTDTFDTLQDFEFKKYVYISTIDVYNDFMNPENNTEDSVIEPAKLSNYGLHKWLAEQIVKKYAMQWIILRLGGMVGPGLKKNAVFDVSQRGNLYVHPDSEYQYINTFEVGQIALKLSEHPGQIFNVCGDGTTSPRKIAESCGIELKPEWTTQRKEKYDINIEKLKKMHTVTRTEEAVQKYIASVRSKRSN